MNSPSRALRQRGFTLIELIAVLVILGILATVAVVSLDDDGAIDARTFHDQTLAALRHAQQTAMTQQRYVCVTFPDQTSLSLSFGNSAACGTILPDLTTPTNPDGTTRAYFVSSRTGSDSRPAGWTNDDGSLSYPAYTALPATLVFDPQGRPDFTGAVRQLAVSGMTALICIAPETGLVYTGAAC